MPQRPFTPNSAAPALQAGVMLLEVLISLLIVALALMGTAALQATAIRVNKGGQLRGQAVFLVSEFAERMEANKAAAIDGKYVLDPEDCPNPIPNVAEDCVSKACDANGLAAYDLDVWKNRVANALPSCAWEIKQTVAGNPSTYTIKVSWKERRTDTTYTDTAATDEQFSYTATRSVMN